MEIKNLLEEVLKSLGVTDVEVKLEHPTNPSHGDYSSNIAMAIFSSAKFSSKGGSASGGKVQSSKFKTPMELAEEIVRNLKLEIRNLKFIDRIDVMPPGFINFWLSREYLVSQLEEVIKDTPRTHPEGQEKVMIEFADPNPFKEFHIGHLRNIALGEAFARLLEAQGAVVWRVNYQGDVGMHVAKAIYGLLRELKAQNAKLKTEKKSLHEKVKLLGEAYTEGTKAYEDDEEAKKEIQALNKKVYAKDPSIIATWELGRKWSLDYFEEIYKRVGTKYNRYYFESEVADPGRKIVLDNITAGIFERHEGAVIFRAQWLHTRVFVTKEDYATYEAKDMALAGIKYKDFPYDRSIIITAHEQAPYFTVVLAAMKKVFPELAAKTTHIAFGFVRLKDTKMSSRLGNVITGAWLLDEAKVKMQKEFTDMDTETLEKVAVGAVKYSMLKFSRESDIQFSFEESINLEGNSGPYIQYTYARTQSVLEKSKVPGLAQLRGAGGKSKFSHERTLLLRLEIEETQLLRLLHRFPEVVGEAAERFAPNLLCNYLFEVAQAFNLFYQKHPILDSKEQDFRLALTVSIGNVLAQGLDLLGIAAPERM